jgi:hypothetical protein
MLDSHDQTAASKLLDDVEVRYLVIDEIVQQYLDVEDVSVETRKYLVDKTLPTVVLGLECLLKELVQKNLEFNSKNYSISKQDLIQTDKPSYSFDSLNFLAQYFFRNNPQYGLTEKGSYAVKSEKIVNQLNQRITEIELQRKARIEAEELARKLERERIEQERQARLMEKKKQFEEFLGLSFRLWIQNLWRKEPGKVYRSEILDEFKSVCDSPDIQIDPVLLAKAQKLVENIQTPGSELPALHEENMIIDVKDTVYSIDSATIERWDIEFYTKALLRLLVDWNQAEITTFLRLLASNLSTKGTSLIGLFKEHLYIPKFNRVSIVKDWFQQLLPAIQVMELPNPLTNEQVKKACTGFCMGKDDPRFQFIPSSLVDDEHIEDDNPAVSYAETSYVRFMKCILGEFGIETFITLMYHIKTETMKDQVLKEKLTEKMVHTEATKSPNVSDDVHYKIMGMMKAITQGKDNVDISYLLQIVQLGLSIHREDSNLTQALAVLNSYISVKNSSTIDALARTVEKVQRHNEDESMVLAQVLVQLDDTNRRQIAEQNEKTSKELQAKQIRKDLETRILEKLKDLKKECTISIPEIAELGRKLILQYFAEIHPEIELISRIGIAELGITKIAADTLLSEEDSIDEKGVVETFIRVVACSDNSTEHLGRIIRPNEGFDYQLMHFGQTVRVNNIAKDDKFNSEWLLNTSDQKLPSALGFLGSALKSNEEPIGSIVLFANEGAFQIPDADFLSVAASALSEVLSIVNTRQQMLLIASQAAEYIRSRTEKNVEIIVKLEELGLVRIIQDISVKSIPVMAYGSPWFSDPGYGIEVLPEGNDKRRTVLSYLEGETSQSNESIAFPITYPSESKPFGYIFADTLSSEEAQYIGQIGKLIGIGIHESEGKTFLPKIDTIELGYSD